MHDTSELVGMILFSKSRELLSLEDLRNKLSSHRAGEVRWQKACKGPIDEEFRCSGCWRRIQIN